MQNQTIKIMFATGVREVPLTEETMKTMTAYFERRKDGIFYFSDKKQKEAIEKIYK